MVSICCFLLACSLVGCVTEPLPAPRAEAKRETEIDPEVLAAQNLVMRKALGGLRDMDLAALEESGWPAGIEEGRRIAAEPIRYMNLGLRRELVGNRYRVRHCLEKAVGGQTGQTTQTAAGAPPAAPAPKNEGPAPKKYILVTVPAAAGGAPLREADPYVFVVEKVNGRLQVTGSDFVPPDYMAGLDDQALLNKMLRDI